MKLRNKAILVIGIATLILMGCVYFSPIRNSLDHLYTIIIIFSLCLFWFIQKFFIKPIEKLNQETSNIIKNNDLFKRTHFVGKNEISLIATHFNELLNIVQTLINKLHLLQKKKKQATVITDNNTKNDTSVTTIMNENHRQLQSIIHSHESLLKIVHDDESSFLNRIYFNEILNKAIHHAKRKDQLLAIILLDIDFSQRSLNFLNKTQYALLLKEAGKRFLEVLRKEDILALSDTNEFYILLNDIGNPKFASKVVEKLFNACTTPIKLEHHEFSLKANAGICIFPHDGDSLETLLSNADSALYKSKYHGANHFQYYTHELGIEAREYLQLESALHKAIHNNELAIHFQPQFSIKKGTIVGVEALLRWEHPVLGIISPHKFISLAEESGLYMQIGEWTLRQACQIVKYWHEEGYSHLSVAVNLSPKQFFNQEIAKVVSKVLNETQLEPHYLELEITEHTIMHDLNAASDILNQLKETGVRIAIDHFGVGYTSIIHLKDLPINAIKIDHSFIKGVPHNPNDSSITSAIIALAHHLGLEVIAENVETAQQVQFLTKQQCDLMQGYFLSQPLSAEKVISQFIKLRDEVMI